MSSNISLASLNAAQNEAIHATEGPILVVAGPGSGKTRVLTQRIAYLLTEYGIPEYSIAAVTFTNKAAKEMKDRVEKLMGRPLKHITLGTFHALCTQMLRQSIDYTPYKPNFTIYDTADQKTAIRDIVKEYDYEVRREPKKLSGQIGKYLGMISQAKNELITPDQIQQERGSKFALREVYSGYMRQLRAANALDFDDLLTQTVFMLEKNPERLAYYQQKFQYIMVDEFQDTNTAQYRLIYLLSHPTQQQNIFVVGDPDQSIYAFRGADYRNVQRFRTDFPNHRLITLDENYRSHQVILDAAMGIIRLNKDHIKRNLFSQRKNGPKISIRESPNGFAESDYILGMIQQLRRSEGYSLRDFAIMYRTNAQSRELERACRDAQIPYRLVGAFQFYDRQEIKDLLAYLHVVNNPDDMIRLERIINTPTRGIGDKSQDSFRTWVIQRGDGPWDALRALLAGEPNPLGRSAGRFLDFANMLGKWLIIKRHKPDLRLVELLDLIIQDTHYESYLKDIAKDTEELMTRRENIQELRYELSQLEDNDLGEYLAYNALQTDNDKNAEISEDAVTLLTLHAAKGLEYPVVFIAGVEEGRLPHERSKTDHDALAEERRLFYVGITRAKDRLYLSYATERQYDEADPSPFLFDLPKEVIDWQYGYGARIASAYRASSPAPSGKAWKWDASKTANDDSKKRRHKFTEGDVVVHSIFGRGTVLKSVVHHDMEEVTIRFDSGVTKPFDADFIKPAK